MKLGVISDTHDFLDPQIPSLFKGVQHILHAGDIGLPRIILELEQIAPVTAVSGNTDEPRFNYRETEIIEIERRKFFVHHIINPQQLAEDLESRIRRERPDVVVFGHTHKPFCRKIDGTLYFNPGYAGKSRFGMDRTVALLHCDAEEIRTEYFSL